MLCSVWKGVLLNRLASFSVWRLLLTHTCGNRPITCRIWNHSGSSVWYMHFPCFVAKAIRLINITSQWWFDRMWFFVVNNFNPTRQGLLCWQSPPTIQLYLNYFCLLLPYFMARRQLILFCFQILFSSSFLLTKS